MNESSTTCQIFLSCLSSDSVVIARAATPNDALGVPGVQRQKLTKIQQRKLAQVQARLVKADADQQAARKAWAALVEELGQAAVARELDMTPQAVYERVRSWGRRNRS